MTSKYEPVKETDNTKVSEIRLSEDESDDEVQHIPRDHPKYTPLQPPSAPEISRDDVMPSPAPPYQTPEQQWTPYAIPPTAGSPYPPGYYMPPQGNYGQQTSTTSNTTVIIQQPSQQPQVRPPRQWSSGLCECGRDWSICLCGFFCQCCLVKRVLHDMNESTLLPCCVPGWLIALRTKMRTQENISGSILNDCCHVFWCGDCTLCQLAYEIKVVKKRQQVVAAAMGPV